MSRLCPIKPLLRQLGDNAYRASPAHLWRTPGATLYRVECRTQFAAVHESGCGRYCCKSLFAPVGSSYGGKIITGQFWTFTTVSAQTRTSACLSAFGAVISRIESPQCSGLLSVSARASLRVNSLPRVRNDPAAAAWGQSIYDSRCPPI